MQNTYLYIRFSDDKQAQGSSYERQLGYAKQYCPTLIEDTDHIYFDSGKSAFSGANLQDGSELKRFYDAVAGGQVPKGSTLLVEDLDRLSRAGMWKASDKLRELTENGITVVTLRDSKRYTGKLLIEWTAAIFQRPLERPIWGVILTGDSKCGKSSLVSVIKAGLGGNHVNDSVTYPGLWEQFSTVHADYSLIAIEDQIAPRDADTRLKQPMSAKSKMFSIKNEQKQVRRDMFSRYMITSNERRPLRFDPTVRRWLAVQFIDHPVSEADSVDFFDRFYAWLTTPEAAAQIVHYFRSVKIEVYNPNLCPRTATLEEMIGLPPLRHFTISYLICQIKLDFENY
ncbi:site-specific recombinase, DNA invertase Pin like protein [Janthinobacterium sp. HH01]|uniref:recombinase family protein n=1 Tax=Janthinobacterium sp. HH01 TaxID=1198452 RepID=UPI0002AE8EC0|nr:recombinase family protein [Janthinobacterium sp. HH01]ELX11470.1 site-specific recombinase, DNA invertase Pin like protein [Janthinobacterium sp. HH01]